MRSYLIFSLLAAALLIIILVIVTIPRQNVPSVKNPNQTQSQSTVELKTETKKDFSQLRFAFGQVLAKSNANFAVSYIDLNSREKLAINGDESFHAASTTKPIVAAFALEQIEKGKLEPNQQILGIPLFERLRLMINISDNSSWEILLDFFGIGKIQEFTKALSLDLTNHFKNTSTTNDLAKFLVAIYQGQVLSDENRQFLLKNMQNTETEDRIPSGISAKNLVFHKAGSFEGGIHDIAIVAHPKNPFILAIMSEGVNDLDTRPQILAEIAKISWEFSSGEL